MKARLFIPSGLFQRCGRKRSGLTIVEIILSIVIIAISAIVLIRVFISAASLNDRARAHTQAVMSVISVLDLVDDEEYRLLLQGEKQKVYEHLSLIPSEGENSGFQTVEWEGRDFLKLVVHFDMDAQPDGCLWVNAVVYDRNNQEIYSAEKRIYQKWEKKGAEK